MTFLVLIVGLLVLRFGGSLTGLHRDEWFDEWRVRLDGALGGQHGLSSLLAIVLPVAVLGLLLWLIRDWWHGLPLFALSLLTLLYSFGRGDLEAELRAYRTAVERGDSQAAYHEAAPFNPTHDEGEASNWPQLQAELEAGLPYRLFEREFAVIFWLVLLGAPGALLYRLTQLRALRAAAAGDVYGGEAASDQAADPATRLLVWLEWLPARLLMPSLAVVGNFAPLMQHAWRLCASRMPAAPLLAEAVREALVLKPVDLSSADGVALVNAVEDLLRRALILWVLVVALLTVFV